MRKAAILALALVVALGAGLAGCAKKEAKAELVTCAACGGKVEASMIKEVDGQKVCTACADKMEAAKAPAAEQAGMHTCVACGMQMAADQMVEKDGKWYCSHCVPEEGGGAGEEAGGGESHEGHGHG